MNDKLVGKASEYIDAVATKLGVAAEHVYGLLVRQQITEGIVDIISGVAITAVITALIVFTANKLKGKLKFNTADEIDMMAMLLFGGIGLMFFGGLLCAGFLLTTDGIKHVINPEYYAIKEIIEAVK